MILGRIRCEKSPQVAPAWFISSYWLWIWLSGYMVGRSAVGRSPKLCKLYLYTKRTFFAAAPKANISTECKEWLFYGVSINPWAVGKPLSIKLRLYLSTKYPVFFGGGDGGALAWMVFSHVRLHIFLILGGIQTLVRLVRDGSPTSSFPTSSFPIPSTSYF